MLLLAAVMTTTRMQRARVRTEECYFPPSQHGEAELHLVPAVLTRKRSQHSVRVLLVCGRCVRLSSLLCSLPVYAT